MLESDDDFIEDEVSEEPLTWSSDFNEFRGVREDFNEEAGPKIEGTSPLGLFTQIWDQPLMDSIVHETNHYAWETITGFFETGDSMPSKSRMNDWVETSVSELYRLIGVMIFMSICVRSRLEEYWMTGVMGMPEFRKLMSRDHYVMLLKFLHFTDNNNIHVQGRDKKIAKIKPIIDYLNKKFQSIYVPHREVSIDESLLLWKGHLSWKQCIRSKAARFGIKSYELCEAVTGYVVNLILYAGKGTTTAETVYGFTTSTAKIVLELFKNYLGKGYTLFMDNFYNSVPLTQFLKKHKTDVVGTLNRRRKDTPVEIQNLQDKRMARGSVVSRHCGDVSVIAWKDVKLVTTVSTYHKTDMAPGHRAGQPCSKPVVVHEYNKYMGGVDLKDQKLSMYLLERKRGIKWYIKVFRRLLNISILNAYIIYCANIGQHKKMTHRQFRFKLAEELCLEFGQNVSSRSRQVPIPTCSRLNRDFNHFPVHNEVTEERTKKQDKFKRGRCVRCRQKCNIACSHCTVYICVGQCWLEYHTLENL
ncbi:piggyBac transposable element-derived protein 4-like [Amyelois transitella]|nr:piggyBac transposable element-derived protein 4-like [Amyelois transitella]XP_060800871.1 piggyBac transposable element-derived protein 4-like [Amyelois transitella]XP_060800888.1 piggyBac transposable element-derived protein 4-like isoform X1 [Amyelois transitella]XP_060801216.1 piggyBac transposable element-derived protein 4-like isoform X1 [Amyelois transitella]XP_060801743.1 piggyBac transposable element-derived protein 4-like [Amyelois transitella]XP_060801744.1 piggyBac transposable e